MKSAIKADATALQIYTYNLIKLTSKLLLFFVQIINLFLDCAEHTGFSTFIVNAENIAEFSSIFSERM